MDIEEKDLTSYMMQKKYDCPVCDNEFRDLSVRKSKLRLSHSDTDLRPFYIPIDPLYYDIAICPKCGYAAMSSNFSKITSLQASKILNDITPKYKQRIYPEKYEPETALERYKLALISSLSKGAKDSELSYLCLKIGWIYRDLGNEERELFFLNHSVNHLRKAYEREDLPFLGMDEPTVLYLIGELLRRTGNKREALRYIGRVVTARGISSKLKDRAIEIKELLKDVEESEES